MAMTFSRSLRVSFAPFARLASFAFSALSVVKGFFPNLTPVLVVSSAVNVFFPHITRDPKRSTP